MFQFFSTVWLSSATSVAKLRGAHVESRHLAQSGYKKYKCHKDGKYTLRIGVMLDEAAVEVLGTPLKQRIDELFAEASKPFEGNFLH